ncbi:MAG TPA: hypothetical protein VLM89_14125 [Phycisphaerae bacterium]|nr:hypothetical protein [Phycisphaerae bacterium]
MSPDNQQQPAGSQYPYPSTPPIQPGGLTMEAEPSKWPTVIGIIAVVLAAIGILGGVCGLVQSFVPRPGMPAGAGGPAMEFHVTPMMTVLAVVGFAFSAGLLAIGIGLLKRRPWSVTLARFWAPLSILLAVCNFFVVHAMQKQMFEAMADQGTPVPQGMAGGIAAGSAACGLMFGCAFPVFMLIWFARRKIKDEVAGWEIKQ